MFKWFLKYENNWGEKENVLGPLYILKFGNMLIMNANNMLMPRPKIQFKKLKWDLEIYLA